MANYSTSEFKSGLKILIDGDPYAIVENEMVKPGKGQAFNRVRVRNLKTGRTIERTWKSGDTVEAADVVDTDMQYLYRDGDFFNFMVPETFEQLAASKEAVGDGAQWLKDGTMCVVTLWNGVPLQVTPPAHSWKRARWCACRCSSAKARVCVSTLARASTCRAARISSGESGVVDGEGHGVGEPRRIEGDGCQSVEAQGHPGAVGHAC
jgi:translation elongation factor P